MAAHQLGNADHVVLLEGLQGLDLAIVLVDGHRRVLFTSRAADATLAAGDGLTLSAGRLVVGDAAGADALDRALDAARQNGTARAASVHRPSGGLSYQVTIIPCRGAPAQPPEEARLVICVKDPSSDLMHAERLLTEMYGLSAAEAAVTTLLAQGLDLRQVAAIRGTAWETVRRQLRSIFDKVGVRRQIDLMRLVYRGLVVFV